MADIKYRGEKRVRDIVERAFGRLSLEDAKRAEAALREANPGLRNLKRLKHGAVLHVPALADLAPAAAPGEISGLSDRVAMTADVLREFQARLAEGSGAETRAAAEVTAQLKSVEVRRLVVRFKLQSLVAGIDKAGGGIS